MSWREISRILGIYILFFSIALSVPLILAFYYQFIAEAKTHPQPHTTLAFLITLIISLGIGGLLKWIGQKAPGVLYRREGLVIVALIWFVTAFVGALPFWVSGTLNNPIDAYFESMSGLTTTGASIMTAKHYSPDGKEIPITTTILSTPPTRYQYYGTITPVTTAEGTVLTGVEAVSKALLFWRSFLQWIGGMGIVVLFLAILPALGVGGKVLYQAEVPGPVKDSLTPRIRSTASILWKIYIFITLAEVILLWTTNANMTLFEAICTSFSTISTGGFTVRNGSIGAFHSATTEWIVVAFMLLGSINFVLYFQIIRRKFSRLKDLELLVYFATLLFGSSVVVLSLIGTPEELLTPAQQAAEVFSIPASLRYGIFQVVSIQTSTGFATANFNYWPFVAQVLLLTSMYFGGMSGSTAGGLKIIRHSMLVRILFQRIEAIFRPNTIRTVYVGTSEVGPNRALTVLSFFFVAIALTLIGTFLLVVDKVDPETALSVNACMLNNIGQAFRAAGPMGNFAFLSGFGKILSLLWMVLGRLEYFAILLLLLPEFWRRS